jgi:hypothetical protein
VYAVVETHGVQQPELAVGVRVGVAVGPVGVFVRVGVSVAVPETRAKFAVRLATVKEVRWTVCEM